jgi:hypothetical protein
MKHRKSARGTHETGYYVQPAPYYFAAITEAQKINSA